MLTTKMDFQSWDPEEERFLVISFDESLGDIT